MRRPNPTLKRLHWVAERYPAKTLAAVMIALAEATGDHGARAAIEDTFVAAPLERYPDPTSGLLDYASKRLVSQPHTRFDRYLPWLARELDRIRRDSPASERQELLNRFRSVVDWAEAERVDLGGYSSPEALDAAEKWSEEHRDIRDVPQGGVIYSWDDGWTIQTLTTPEQLEAEGDVMQHCVAEYDVDLDDQVLEPGGDHVAVYSLRDPKGRPHATMEYNIEFTENRHVAQLRGKQNATPKPEYLRRMVEFRLAHLTERELKPVEPPPHADGMRERFIGAFETPAEKDRILVYDDGTVLMWDDVPGHADDLRHEARELYPDNLPAQRQHVIIALDRTYPAEILGGDWARTYGLWLAWAVLVATRGRVKIPESEDEMVQWMFDARVDPSVCRPFARRTANVAELYGRLTR